MKDFAYAKKEADLVVSQLQTLNHDSTAQHQELMQQLPTSKNFTLDDLKKAFELVNNFNLKLLSKQNDIESLLEAQSVIHLQQIREEREARLLADERARISEKNQKILLEQSNITNALLSEINRDASF